MIGNPLFSAIAARPTEAEVLIGDQQTWRAGELMTAIDEFASRLQGSSALAVLADNSPAWVIADLAAMRAGVPQVPLPTFFNPEQLAHLLEQSGADSVLTDQPERIGALDLGFVVTGCWCGLIRLQRPRARTAPALPPGTGKISFTSGSTGTPKGACLSTAGLIDTAQAVASRLADLPIDRHLAVLPLSLLLENSAGIYAPLLRGAAIHLPGLETLGWHGMAGFNPAALMRCIAETQASSLILVPELLKAWCLALAASGARAPESLSYVAVGGARVAPESIEGARTLGIPAYQGYGLTECGSVVSLNRPGDDATAGEDVGRPLDHIRIRVIDGELHIHSRAFLGYLDQPQPQASTCENSTAFASGDLGHIDARGHLHLSGRRKHLLITSFGRNISPEWVEAMLLAQPAILQAVVTGDAEPFLSAVLVPGPGTTAAAVDAAVAAANAQLPDYAQIACWIVSAPFSLQNGLATGNGRPVRSAILKKHESGLAELAATLNPQANTHEKETADVVL